VLITVCASAVALSNLVVPGATATAALERLSRDGHKLGRRVIHQLRVLEEQHGRGGQHPGGELVDRILEAGLSELLVEVRDRTRRWKRQVEGDAQQREPGD